MAYKIRFRRGETSPVLIYTPDVGEPVWDLQTKQLYIGDNSTVGGIPINGPIGGFYGTTIRGKCYYVDENNILQIADNTDTVDFYNVLFGIGTGKLGEIQRDLPMRGLTLTDGRKWLGTVGDLVSSPPSSAGSWIIPIGMAKNNILSLMINNFNIQRNFGGW